jgi:hypothetical protein
VVDIIWGLNGVNKTGVDRFNASDIGIADWDFNFDPTPPESQNQTIDFCEDLMDPKHGLLFSYDGESLECWMLDFKKFIKE